MRIMRVSTRRATMLAGDHNHGVPTPMYFKGVPTDGGGANEFISATPRGRIRD